MSAPAITEGLKFKAPYYSGEFEVIRIQKTVHQLCDMRITASDGDQWVEFGWSIERIKAEFERGGYEEIKPNSVNISII